MSKYFMIDPEEVRENLRKLMYVKRWNRTQTANELGINRSHMGSFLNDKWSPKRMYLESVQMRINEINRSSENDK
jgi:hypothetical protein